MDVSELPVICFVSKLRQRYGWDETPELTLREGKMTGSI